MLKLVLALVLALLAVRGVFLLARAFRSLQQAAQSANWPRTAGVVSRQDEVRDGKLMSTKATVSYSVDGRAYTTNLISFGQTLKPFDRTTAGLQRFRYPDEASVSVSYDPRNPAAAVLVPGRHAEDYSPLGRALAFLLPVILCCLQYPGMVRAIDAGKAFDRQLENMRAMGQQQDVEFTVPGAMRPNPMSGASLVSAIVASAFAAGIFGLGLLGLTSGLEKMYYAAVSPGWPAADGVVTENIGADAMNRRYDKGDDSIYPPGFVYRYLAGGVTHVGSARRFRSVRQDGDGRFDAPDSLPAGAKVKVYYYPSDPDIAVLEPGVDGQAYILPAVCAVVILMSLAVFHWFLPMLLQ